MQTLEDKAQAIASVLWLMEDHFRMVKAGRVGSCIRYERKPDGLERWRPPVLEEFEDWPVEEISRWIGVQKRVSAKYRLWPIGLALCKLHARNGGISAAVRAYYVEIPPVNWYAEMEERAGEGLRFMAADVPGEVTAWGERPKTRIEIIKDLLSTDRTTQDIAVYVGCSPSYVRRIRRTIKDRSERVLSAVS